MKKIISVFFAALLVLVMVVPVMAEDYTTNDIVSLVASKTHSSDRYEKTAQDFFNANTFTQDEINGMMSDAKEAVAVWDEAGADLQFAALPEDVQNQLQSMAVVAAKKVGATLTVNGKTVTVVDKNGKSFSVTRASSSASGLSSTTSPIKQTGADYTIAFIIAGVLIAGTAAAFVYSRKNSSVGE